MNISPLEDLPFVVKKAWENILQNKDAKEDDHFFLSGGDSLLASMLIVSLTETVQIEITLGDLYDNPTLNELLAFIEGKRE